MDDEYKSFLAELGGAPQDQGGSSGMRNMGGGGGGRQSRPGDDLPDNCKLYVGNLSPAVTDAVLKSLMEPFGNVLHAVVLLDMTTGGQPPAVFHQLLLPPPAVVPTQGVAPVWSMAIRGAPVNNNSLAMLCSSVSCYVVSLRLARPLLPHVLPSVMIFSKQGAGNCRSEQRLWLCPHGQCRVSDQCSLRNEREDDGWAATGGALAQRRP